MRGIGLSLLERVFSWQDPSLWILLAATVLLLLVLVQKLLKRESPRVPVLSIAAVWGTWLVYLLSLYGMYLFSMPLKEAVVLASFDKYMSSVNIFILGVAGHPDAAVLGRGPDFLEPCRRVRLPVSPLSLPGEPAPAGDQAGL